MSAQRWQVWDDKSRNIGQEGEQRSAVCPGPGNVGKEGDRGTVPGSVLGQGNQAGDERP